MTPSDTPPAHIHLITDAEGLDRLSAAILGAERIALDTEFHAERRYRPELMLLQIATDARTAWIVDPLAVPPQALAPAIARAHVLVHGGQNDLRLLDQALGVRPAQVFDTQQGAGLLGMHYPERLSRLGAALLGREMDKGATLSDWSSRPLSEAQLRYAAEDTLSLFAITEALEARLDLVGRRALAWQASAEMMAETLREISPEEESREWEIVRRLDSDARKALIALLAWRQKTAQQRNQPPHYILSNGVLLDLARRQPKQVRDLAENRRIHPSFIKHNGAGVLEALRGARAQPEPPAPPEPHHHRCARAVMLWAELISEEAGLAPGMVMSDALALRIAQEGAGALGGWRAFLQPRLAAFLAGDVSVSISKDTRKVCLNQVFSDPRGP